MKINLREMLGRLDLETDNRYDLRNHYDSSKLSDFTKNRLAEAIDKKASAEKINRILNENFAIDIFPRDSEEYEKLEKVADYLTNYSPNNIYYRVEKTYFDFGQNWMWTTIIAYNKKGDSWQALYPKQQEEVLLCQTDDEIEEVAKKILRESRLDKGFTEAYEPEDDRTEEEVYQDWLDAGAVPNYDEEPPFESLKEADYDRPGYEDMYIVSWEDSIGDYHETKVKAKYPQDAIDKIRKTKYIYKVINVEKIDKFVSSKRIRKADLIENDSLAEASYGGAYDIEDDMYFTKEEIVEFASDMVDNFSDWSHHKCDLEDVYMTNPKHLVIDVYDYDDGVTHRAEVNIDMRKIRTPKSIYRYEQDIITQWQNAFDEYHEYDESLTEAKKVGSNKISQGMNLPGKNFELVKITDGVVSSKDRYECRIYSRELDNNRDYGFYQGEVIFSEDYDPQLIDSVFPDEGTKVKLAIYRVPEDDPDHDWTGDYFVDYIDEINESLTEEVEEEQLYKIVCKSGASEWPFESALSYEDAEEMVEYYGGRWIDERGFEWSMEIEEDDESTERAYPFEESLNEARNIEPKYKDGDIVFVGDADGYHGTFLIKGDFRNIPEELYHNIRRIYKYGNLDKPYYKVEYKIDSNHLFEEDYRKFFEYITPILKNANISIFRSEKDIDYNESLSEKLIPAPQEVVDELLDILNKFGFVLDDSLAHPIGKTWSGNTHIQVINKDSHIEETEEPDTYAERLMEYVPDEMENEIDALSEREKVRITYNFGINRDWQVTGGLDVWEKHIPGKQDESLDEDVLEYDDEMSDTWADLFDVASPQEVADNFRKDVKSKDKVYKPSKNESLNEAYEYLYDEPFIDSLDGFVKRVSGLSADELDDEVWNEYFHEYGVYKEKYYSKVFESDLRKQLTEKGLEVISIDAQEHQTLVTVEFDNTEKTFRFRFRLFDLNDMTTEYYVHYIVSMIAGYFGLNESLKEGFEDYLFRHRVSPDDIQDDQDYDVYWNRFYNELELEREREEDLEEQINLPGYAVRYITGYAGNGVNNSETEWFRTEEERDRRVKELEDKNYIGIKTWKMDNFYHTLPKEESLNEGIEDLDSISSTKAKDMTDEDFKVLKPLVDEYLKDRKALGTWPDSVDERNFVKKWYKLADKCKEIAKNGMQGITGYGRLNDFIKIKILELARSVDNTFLWYVRNQLEKFGELSESLQEKLSNKDKHIYIKEIVNAEDKEDLEDIAHEIYFYDKRLFSQLRHFPKDKTFEQQKDYMIKVLQDSLEESLKEDIEDYVDVEEYSDFDDDTVEEGTNFIEDGIEWVWVERIAGPIHLDFDNWAVWSAREYVDPRDFMTIHDDGKGYEFDGDGFKKKAMAAPVNYFVVDEDTGFIDWGPVESQTEAQDFLNSKVEDWEKDESLNESEELKEDYWYTLHYEDIGGGKEYDYEVTYDELFDCLLELAFEEDDAPEDTKEYMDWVENNFDSLYSKYKDDILDYFEEDASQKEYDERDPSDRYDPYADRGVSPRDFY